MSSIATAVFKASIGLLINKARDTAAEKLKEGDVTDQKFRSLIVREIDQINSKLDGLARKDLLSSISAFKEGIAILFDVFDEANKGVNERKENVTRQAAAAAAIAVESVEVSWQSSASAQAKAVFLASKLANLPLIDLNESSKELLSDAKDRFKEARSKARDAFSNEALDTSDRIECVRLTSSNSQIQNKRATKGFILIRHKRSQICTCLQLSSSIASFVWKPAHFKLRSYGGA